MPGRSASCTCSRLRRANRAVTQFYDDALAPAGLRTTQFALLRTLDAGAAHTISSLAHAMLLDRTALSRNLDPLVERGLVEVRHGTDARTREVVLLPAGRTALAVAEPHWRAAEASLARRIGAQRLDALLGVLRDLESLHPHPAPPKEAR
jgi:DNA-binding MarR family transcriptional regulator